MPCANIYISLSHHRVFPSGIWLCSAGNPHSIPFSTLWHVTLQHKILVSFAHNRLAPQKQSFRIPSQCPSSALGILMSTTHFVYLHLCPARSGHSIYTVFLPVSSVHHSHVRYSVCHVSKLLCFAVSILLTLEGGVENPHPDKLVPPYP
jgi:hypothetical protein